MKSNWLKTLLALVLIGFALYFLNKGHYWTNFTNLSWLDILISFLLCFLIFLLTSWRNRYVLERQYNVKLSLFDQITLPIAMNLWGLVLPIQGSVLYFIFFLKNKYQMRAAHGTAIVLYTYLINFIIAGLFLLGYAIFLKQFGGLALTGLIFIFSPLIVFLLNLLLQKIPGNWQFLVKVKQIIGSIQSSSQDLLKDPKTNLIVTAQTILRLALRSLWYYAAAMAFGLDVAIPVVIILALVNDFTSIIRLVPGNFGVDELISGSILIAFGGQMGEGVLLTLFIKSVTLVYTFSIGIWATLVNLPYFGAKNLSAFWQNLRKEENA